MLNKKIYPYTTGTINEATLIETITYTYGNSGWRDQLTSYNGQSITYNAMGQPTSYMGKTMTWSGTNLMSVSATGLALSYQYDNSGLRTSKTHNNITTEYYRENGRLIREKRTGVDIWYIYDAQGNIIGIDYNGVRYYYVTNALGDVRYIVNASGAIVVTYAYDTWGKVMSTSGSLALTVGANNPIRYRGYYYDTETSLYYLQSRYYDPNTGRFISPDQIIDLGNLYAYCGNDPINYTDSSGYSKFTDWIKKIMHKGTNALDKSLGAIEASSLLVASQLNKVATSLYKTASSSHFVIDKIVVANTFGGMHKAFVSLGDDISILASKASRVAKIAKGIGIALFALDLGLSAYINYSNPDLTIDQKRAYTIIDWTISAAVFTLVFGLGPVGFVFGMGVWIAYEFWAKDLLRNSIDNALI